MNLPLYAFRKLVLSEALALHTTKTSSNKQDLLKLADVCVPVHAVEKQQRGTPVARHERAGRRVARQNRERGRYRHGRTGLGAAEKRRPQNRQRRRVLGLFIASGWLTSVSKGGTGFVCTAYLCAWVEWEGLDIRAGAVSSFHSVQAGICVLFLGIWQVGKEERLNKEKRSS